MLLFTKSTLNTQPCDDDGGCEGGGGRSGGGCVGDGSGVHGQMMMVNLEIFC